jgi:Zn-dependent M28 family amino/carboxypeptidase
VSGNGQYIEGLPMVMVGNEVAQSLFSPKGYDVRTLESLLRDGRPISFATGVRARLRAMGNHYENAATCNVVALLEGSDPVLKDEYLLFGGHLDHLGPWPVLHPGANDNASGSAVVLGLAQAFSSLQTRPKRSIVFALFGAEELGLLGSRHMAAHLPAFPSRLTLMSNHDINGVGKAIHVAGGITYPDLYRLMEGANARFNIGAALSAGEISPVDGNSDYAPFLEKGIPAYNIGVRGGVGGGIHTAEDSIYTITPKIMEDIVRLFFAAGFLYADR